MTCNIMTAIGCTDATNFFMIWIGLAILFFIVVLAKKWIGEEQSLGISWSWVGSAVVSFPLYIAIAIIVGQAKWAILSGLVGVFLGGITFARWWGE